MNNVAWTLLTIAQDTTPSDTSAGSQVTGLTVDPLRVLLNGLDRLDNLNHPEILLDTLNDLHIIWAVIFVILGVISVTNGYHWHKWIVMIISFLVGLELGSFLSESMAVSAVVAGSVGILVAVVAWPLMKHAITICGALAGAFLGANVWTALEFPPDTYYAGAVAGFIMFGMLALMAQKVVIVAMTCIAGATLLVLGGVALMLNVDGWHAGLTDSFESNTIVLPLVTLVIAVFGFVLQQGSAFAAPQKKPDAKPATA